MEYLDECNLKINDIKNDLSFIKDNLYNKNNEINILNIAKKTNKNISEIVNFISSIYQKESGSNKGFSHYAGNTFNPLGSNLLFLDLALNINGSLSNSDKNKFYKIYENTKNEFDIILDILKIDDKKHFEYFCNEKSNNSDSRDATISKILDEFKPYSEAA